MNELLYLQQKFQFIMMLLKHKLHKEAMMELLKSLQNLENPDLVDFAKEISDHLNEHDKLRIDCTFS